MSNRSEAESDFGFSPPTNRENALQAAQYHALLAIHDELRGLREDIAQITSPTVDPPSRNCGICRKPTDAGDLTVGMWRIHHKCWQREGDQYARIMAEAERG